MAKIVPGLWQFVTAEPRSLILCLFRRQTSAEGSASGNMFSGQRTVYEAICGKAGGPDAALLHTLTML